MNTNHHNPEELLVRGKSASLSASERTDMRETLMSYARFHGAREIAPKTSFFSYTLWSRVVVAATFVFVVSGTTGYASLESVPGDLLYGVKTNVVEEAIGVLQLTPESRLRYSTHLLEERYGELRELREEEALTPELLAEITEGMDGHLADMRHEVDGAPQGDVLASTAEASAVTRAAVRMVREEESDSMESLSDAATSMHLNELDELVEAGDVAAANEYIEAQFAEIASELNENDLASSTTAQVNEYLDDTAEALSTGDVEAAVRRANDAVQAILTEEYASDFEDEVEE